MDWVSRFIMEYKGQLLCLKNQCCVMIMGKGSKADYRKRAIAIRLTKYLIIIVTCDYV